MKTCMLFPGQGAQAIGMGKDLYDASKKVRTMFEEASEASKIDLAALIFSGTEDELKQTRNTQVALALVECAASTALHERGALIQGTGGFSLGEWPALVEAGVISFGEMIRLVAERGRLMDEAGRRSGGSSMSAILGMDPAAIEAAIKASGVKDVWVANYNSPAQSVVSGTEAGLAVTDVAIKEAGAKRVVRLKVSGAFHSPIMRYAYDGFKEFIADVVFADPKLDFFSNVTGGKVGTGAELKSLAAEQIISPVRWIDEQKAILDAGFVRCLEAGPGTVLGGLWKSASSDVPCQPAGTMEQISAVSL
ncbi:MAG: ACP S-malonyltransferase [Spirochaetia bacterium]|jgi:[acyl-carrier-protein] S-malonyltransferase|nr:ACP S-malonyltransferase [Spirochaetia bacterium]